MDDGYVQVMKRLDDDIKELDLLYQKKIKELEKYDPGTDKFKQIIEESSKIHAEIEHKKEEKQKIFLSTNFSNNDRSDGLLVNEDDDLDLRAIDKLDIFQVLNLIYMEFMKYDNGFNDFKIYELDWKNGHYSSDFAVREIYDALQHSNSVAIVLFDKGAKHFSALYLKENKAYYFDSLSYVLKPKILKHLKKYALITEFIDKTDYTQKLQDNSSDCGFYVVYALTQFMLGRSDTLERENVPGIKELREIYQSDFDNNSIVSINDLHTFHQNNTDLFLISYNRRYHNKRFPQEYDSDYTSTKRMKKRGSDPVKKRTKSKEALFKRTSDPLKKSSDDKRQAHDNITRLIKRKTSTIDLTEDSTQNVYPNTRSRQKATKQKSPAVAESENEEYDTEEDLNESIYDFTTDPEVYLDSITVFILLAILLEKAGLQDRCGIMVLGWKNRKLTIPLNYNSINENTDKAIAIIINDNIRGVMHFCCIYIPPFDPNKQEDIFWYSDPLKSRRLPDSIIKDFQNKCNLKFKNLNMLIQNDDYNCGVYVVYILSQLITNERIDTAIDGDELRGEYQTLFLENNIFSFDEAMMKYDYYIEMFRITESETRADDQNRKQSSINDILFSVQREVEMNEEFLNRKEVQELIESIIDQVEVNTFLETNKNNLEPNEPQQELVEQEIKEGNDYLKVLDKTLQKLFNRLRKEPFQVLKKHRDDKKEEETLRRQHSRDKKLQTLAEKLADKFNNAHTKEPFQVLNTWTIKIKK